MRRNLFALIASAAMAGTFVAAQTPAPSTQQPAGGSSTQQPRPSAASEASANQEMTLTGCLVQGSGPNVFILENAKTGTGAAASATAPAAPAASAASTAEGKSYILTSAASVDLRSQLNRQVRIVGTAAQIAASMSGASRPEPAAGQGSGSATAPGAGSSSASGSGSSSTPSAGAASASAQSGPGAMAAAQERNLPRLTAKSVARVADTCATVS